MPHQEASAMATFGDAVLVACIEAAAKVAAAWAAAPTTNADSTVSLFGSILDAAIEKADATTSMPG